MLQSLWLISIVFGMNGYKILKCFRKEQRVSGELPCPATGLIIIERSSCRSNRVCQQRAVLLLAQSNWNRNVVRAAVIKWLPQLIVLKQTLSASRLVPRSFSSQGKITPASFHFRNGKAHWIIIFVAGETKQTSLIMWWVYLGLLFASIMNWASSWDYGTYHIGDQGMLSRSCAVSPSRQSLRCSHKLSMEVDEGSDQQSDI